MQEPLSDSKNSADELQAKARQMYITMPVVRIALIAKRFKIGGALIKTWIDEQDWLDARRTFHEKEVKSLLKDIDDPKKSAKAILKISKKVEKHLDNQLATRNSDQFSIKDLSEYSEVVNRLQQIQLKSYERLGIK